MCVVEFLVIRVILGARVLSLVNEMVVKRSEKSLFCLSCAAERDGTWSSSSGMTIPFL